MSEDRTVDEHGIPSEAISARPSVESEAMDALSKLPVETRRSIANAVLYETVRGAALKAMTKLRSTSRLNLGDVAIERFAHGVATQVVDEMTNPATDKALAMLVTLALFVAALDLKK